MKKILLITFLLIPFLGFSQTKSIDGFLGIKFGSSKADVTDAIKAKGGTFVKKEVGTSEVLYFDNITLGHRATSTFYVKFINDKAYEADFFFDPQLEAKTIEYYDNLVSDINDVYGKGKSYKDFKEPYKDGDGYEITAIGSGDAKYTTYWEFKKDNKNTITAEILTNYHINLTYQDDKLVDEAIAAQKAKEKGDF